MYLNGIDECECDINQELIDPLQTTDANQFLKAKEVEDKSEVLFDLANIAGVFNAVRNFLG